MNSLSTIQSAVGAEIVLDGRRYVNFGGSSYLGLGANAQIRQAGLDSLCKWGGGYQFHRSYGIINPSHQQAEVAAAEFFETQGALYLATGYYFGLVSIAAWRHEIGAVFFDDWAHTSLREGIAASGLNSYGFRHLDVGDLELKLKQHLRPGQKPLIATDGLYSTFGEIAPLAEFARVIEPYGGKLLVDESHSFGVLGANGRGACEHHLIPLSSVLVGGSTGKAFGAAGGIVPCNSAQISVYRSVSAGRGAASGLPAAAAMCAASFNYVREHPELRQRLGENITRLKDGFRTIGLQVIDNSAPVAAFTVGSSESMQTLQERLRAEGIFVFHSTYIGAGAAGVIRCGIFADHTSEHIDRLLGSLRRLI